MSITDQIIALEKELEVLQSDGDHDILLLKENFKKKKEYIKTMFETNLIEKKQALESEMYARVAQYKLDKENSKVDTRMLLDTQLKQEYDRIFQIALDLFWHS